MLGMVLENRSSAYKGDDFFIFIYRLEQNGGEKSRGRQLYYYEVGISSEGERKEKRKRRRGTNCLRGKESGKEEGEKQSREGMRKGRRI